MVHQVVFLALVLAAWLVQGQFDNCGLSSNTRFLTFNRKLMSTAPVLFPKTEAELKSIVKRAAQRGCKVRVRGAGHSSNGIIAQAAEKKVVVVHLGRLKTTAWPDSINAKTCVATIGTGKSLLGLIAMAKPAGCVHFTQTAFPLFSVGGVISNSVTGNGHGAGMFYDYVVGVRVMLPSGEIRTITDESSLRFFRGAYGLTGIILSIKYQLKRDYQFQMKSLVHEYDFFNGGQAAYVALGTDQAVMLATYSGSECFMNVYPSQTTGKQSVTCFVLTQATTNQTFPSGSSQDKATQAELVSLYNKVKKQHPNLSYEGGKLVNVQSACDLIPAPFCNSKLTVSAGLMQSSTQVYNASWIAAGSAQGARDGYNQFTDLYPFTALAMFVPANNLVQAVGAYVQIVGPFLGQGENASWLPNLAFEWRPVTPKGSSAFDILVGGNYVLSD
ncbi:hypothetical protein BASA81_007412 [Batrachochytrium salamandrivorans]|nr:hypothetical protein BASA81_007412 [Batrachochytrium salamandrivorans]